MSIVSFECAVASSIYFFASFLKLLPVRAGLISKEAGKLSDYLQERLSGLLNGNRRDSYDGEAVCQHDEREARRIMEHVLEALDMRQEDLGRLPKNERRKAVLAWLIRKNTTMTNEWISQQLNMGHISNVTNYVRHVGQATDKSIRQLRQQFANILIT